jgi:tRNA pseudouridine38-40 synthase
LTIEYDGTNFSGWQIQRNSVTIQQILKEKIELILQEKINLLGSGRTDSGVHAFGQVANFQSESNIQISKFLHSLNSLLPNGINIKKMEIANSNFHSRFDAKKRSYLYFFSTQKSPFSEKYILHNPYFNKYEIEKLNKISREFLGEKDFTSFAKTKSEIENKNCTIYSIWWKRKKNITIFYIEANRFLHGMVRAIIGTILEVYNYDDFKEKIADILEAKNRIYAGKAVKSKGLFLFKVKY